MSPTVDALGLLEWLDEALAKARDLRADATTTYTNVVVAAVGVGATDATRELARHYAEGCIDGNITALERVRSEIARRLQ